MAAATPRGVASGATHAGNRRHGERGQECEAIRRSALFRLVLVERTGGSRCVHYLILGGSLMVISLGIRWLLGRLMTCGFASLWFHRHSTVARCGSRAGCACSNMGTARSAVPTQPSAVARTLSAES
jgi:hypothetical protein